jgi:hypothetical protein
MQQRLPIDHHIPMPMIHLPLLLPPPPLKEAPSSPPAPPRPPRTPSPHCMLVEFQRRVWRCGAGGGSGEGLWMEVCGGGGRMGQKVWCEGHRARHGLLCVYTHMLCICACLCVHVCAYECECEYVYIYIYTYIYIHGRECVVRGAPGTSRSPAYIYISYVCVCVYTYVMYVCVLNMARRCGAKGTGHVKGSFVCVCVCVCVYV